MGYLLPALTDAKFENQRDVVLNERRQNYENRPYGFAGMAIVAALFPPDHPYHWLTIGERRRHPRRAAGRRAGVLPDLLPPAQRLARARGRRRHRRALELATRYFGELDAGDDAAARRVRAAARARGRGRLLLEDRVELPRLYLAWHSPALFAADDAELDLVAEVLASGKTSRLYRTLVYEQRIATEIAASQNSRELGGFFQIVATAAPGRTLAELEQAISRGDRRRSSTTGRPPARWSAAWRRPKRNFIYRLQTVGGFGGKSDQLNAYNVFLGDPGFFERDLERYRRVTPSRCSARRAQWLRPTRASSLSVVPSGRPSWRSPAPSRWRCRDARRSRAPSVARARAAVSLSRDSPAHARQRPARVDRRASRGAARQLSRAVPVGAAADPPERPGLAAITGDMLDEGMRRSDALELHDALGAHRRAPRLGDRLGRDDPDAVDLARFADRGLALLADMVIRPRLDAADFERVRELRLNRLVQLRDLRRRSPSARSRELLYRRSSLRPLPIGPKRRSRR